MSQFGLFEEGCVRRTNRPAAQVIADLRRSLSYDDSPGCGVASYHAATPNPHRPDFEACVVAALERHFGYRPHRWMASIYLELPDERRSQWSAHAVFVTQDEAATELTDMSLLLRALAGADVQTPGALREAAAARAVDEDATWLAATQAELDARSALDASPVDAPGHGVLCAEWMAARNRAAALRRDLIDEFHKSHSWREFVQ